MRVQGFEKRIERAELAAKAQSKFSAECICFPADEQPFFGLPIEEQIAAKVKCPLARGPFQTDIPHLRTQMASRQREDPLAPSEHAISQSVGSRFSAQPVASRRGGDCRWTNPSSTKRWEYVGSARTSSAAPNMNWVGAEEKQQCVDTICSS